MNEIMRILKEEIFFHLKILLGDDGDWKRTEVISWKSYLTSISKLGLSAKHKYLE